MKHVAIFFIKIYKRFLSAGLDAKCRFYPTCSVYAMISLDHHGFFKGGTLAFWRILRCNPFGKSGEDKPPISKHKYRHFI
ncbi:MAG: membrane protein insertion efficiency factor YidD [Bacillota bacterium]